MGTTLSKVLVRAKNDDRLVCGVFECAHHLEKNPDNAMVCILPAVAPNLISISIQHKLIEAYCLENSIQVLKVGFCVSILRTLISTAKKACRKS